MSELNPFYLQIEQDRINAHIRRSVGDLVAEADSTMPGPEGGDTFLTPAEVAAVKAQALKLAKDSVSHFLHIRTIHMCVYASLDGLNTV